MESVRREGGEKRVPHEGRKWVQAREAIIAIIKYNSVAFTVYQTLPHHFFHLISTAALWKVNSKAFLPTRVALVNELSLSSNVFQMNSVRNLPIFPYIFIRLIFRNCTWQFLPGLGGLEFIKLSLSNVPHGPVLRFLILPTNSECWLKSQLLPSPRPAPSAKCVLSAMTQLQSFLFLC